MRHFHINHISEADIGMRVEDEKLQFLKRKIWEYLPDADVYLIGSRVNDSLKGGDIDILVIGERELTGQEKRNIRLAFYKELGEQKVDIISLTNNDSSTFKQLVLLDGVKI
jgi:predicted nucleotidyltransferase